jgi:hypothetical protein
MKKDIEGGEILKRLRIADLRRNGAKTSGQNNFHLRFVIYLRGKEKRKD